MVIAEQLFPLMTSVDRKSLADIVSKTAFAERFDLSGARPASVALNSVASNSLTVGI
jgi:hypothetical protein